MDRIQNWILNAIRKLDNGRRANAFEKTGKGEGGNNMNKEDLLWTVRLIILTNSFTATILFGVFKVILMVIGN